jgi:hypothetical protein
MRGPPGSVVHPRAVSGPLICSDGFGGCQERRLAITLELVSFRLVTKLIVAIKPRRHVLGPFYGYAGAAAEDVGHDGASASTMDR